MSKEKQTGILHIDKDNHQVISIHKGDDEIIFDLIDDRVIIEICEKHGLAQIVLGLELSTKNQRGQNKMSIINAIRNKLLHILVACIKNDTMYQKKL